MSVILLVNGSNEYINVYNGDADNFSFSDIIGYAKNGEVGVIIKTYEDSQQSLLYHYVKIAFATGMVGIVHGGLLKILDEKRQIDIDVNLENLSICDEDV